MDDRIIPLSGSGHVVAWIWVQVSGHHYHEEMVSGIIPSIGAWVYVLWYHVVHVTRYSPYATMATVW